MGNEWILAAFLNVPESHLAYAGFGALTTVVMKCPIYGIATCFHAGFLLGLLFDPEDGCDMFLRNFS
jgi:uncharacterized protein involved in propanediol utilization